MIPSSEAVYLGIPGLIQYRQPESVSSLLAHLSPNVRQLTYHMLRSSLANAFDSAPKCCA